MYSTFPRFAMKAFEAKHTRGAHSLCKPKTNTKLGFELYYLDHHVLRGMVGF